MLSGDNEILNRDAEAKKSETASAKEVTFNNTANVPRETVEPIAYKVILKDVYKSNVVSIE